MEKHELDALIKRRFDAGKTLSIHRIVDEDFPSHTISKAAVRYYGNWKSAKKAICGIVTASHIGISDIHQKVDELTQAGLDITSKNLGKQYHNAISREFRSLDNYRKMRGIESGVKRWSEAEIKAELTSEIELGRTLGDINRDRSDLYSVVLRKYGTFEELSRVTGIIVPRSNNRKYTDTQLQQFVESAVESGMSGARARLSDDRLFCACRKRWGSWNKALTANGFTPKWKSPKKDWTCEEIKETYLTEIKSGVHRKDISNEGIIRKMFGSIAQLRAELGLDKQDGQSQKKILHRVEIDCYINQALKWDVDNINEQLLDELDANLTHSIKHHYGSTPNYFSIIDIDRYKKPYTPFTWTRENIVWQIERWIREGYPVNYTAIQSRHKGIIVASRRIFGSYKKAFEYAQINYDDHRVDTAMASRYGAEFEQIVGEIFTELHLSYKREPAINGCHPDFVFGKHWVDAKLSEWTVSLADCSTIHKYLPNCRRLSIVYLRQIRKETFYTNELGVDMIHVSEILKALSPQRAEYYNEKLNAIITQLETIAA